jgi:PIN domain nuclease of toxin-antitoxin system
MNCLLDTHTVVCFAENSPRLTQNASRIILDIGNTQTIGPGSP